ncbi:hypothetical protein L218DRAFT_1075990 [Marasmius fiardii PR-910]|nr:hypothetical protein L218DRAFT_1075990 [Marasmius fiardii PR-910]
MRGAPSNELFEQALTQNARVKKASSAQPYDADRVVDDLFESGPNTLPMGQDSSDPGKMKLSDEFIDLFCSAVQEMNNLEGLLVSPQGVDTHNSRPLSFANGPAEIGQFKSLFTTENPQVPQYSLQYNQYAPVMTGSESSTVGDVHTRRQPAVVPEQTAPSSGSYYPLSDHPSTSSRAFNTLKSSTFPILTGSENTDTDGLGTKVNPERIYFPVVDKDGNGVMIALFDFGPDSHQVHPTPLQAKRLEHAFPTLPSHLLNGICKTVPPYALRCPIKGCLMPLKDSELPTVNEHLDIHFAFKVGLGWRNSESQQNTPRQSFGCCSTEMRGASLSQHIIDIHFQTKVTLCRFCGASMSRPSNHFARHLFQCEALRRFRVLHISEVQNLERGAKKKKKKRSFESVV